MYALVVSKPSGRLDKTHTVGRDGNPQSGAAIQVDLFRMVHTPRRYRTMLVENEMDGVGNNAGAGRADEATRTVTDMCCDGGCLVEAQERRGKRLNWAKRPKDNPVFW